LVGGGVVVAACRNPGAVPSSIDSMGKLDIRELLRQQDPSMRFEENRRGCEFDLEEGN
jgi:hypothetical protein